MKTHRITLESNPLDAPCCITIKCDDGRDLLVQTDWDWPGVASTFGWSAKPVENGSGETCEHEMTDGTIDCPVCGKTASTMISEARTWIDEHDGAEAEDPGYFD